MAKEKHYKEFVMAARHGNLPTIQRMFTGENLVLLDVKFLAMLLFIDANMDIWPLFMNYFELELTLIGKGVILPHCTKPVAMAEALKWWKLFWQWVPMSMRPFMRVIPD